MKVDGDIGNNLEFYLQCSDYLFLQLKRQGQNLKGQIWKRGIKERPITSLIGFFLSHVEVFVSDFREIYFAYTVSVSAYTYLLNRVPTLD